MEDELLARVVVAEDLEDAPAEVDHVECRQDEHVLAAVLEMLQLDGAVYHVVEAHGVVVDRLEAAAHVGVGGLFLHDAHGAEDHRQRRLQVVRYCRKEGEFALDVLEGRLSLLLPQRPQGAPPHVPDDGRDDGQRGEHVDRDGPPRQGPWRGDPERHRERAAGRADGLDQQSAGAHFQPGERDGVCPLGHDDPAVGRVGRRRGELVHEALRRVGRVVERAHHQGDAAAVGNIDASAAAGRLVYVEMAVAVAVHDESDGLVVGDIAQVAVIDFKDFVGTSEQDVAGDGVLVDSRVRLLRDRKERHAQGRAVPDAPYVAQGRDPYAVADLAHGEHRLVAAGVGEHDSAMGAVAVKDCGAAAEGAPYAALAVGAHMGRVGAGELMDVEPVEAAGGRTVAAEHAVSEKEYPQVSGAVGGHVVDQIVGQTGPGRRAAVGVQREIGRHGAPCAAQTRLADAVYAAKEAADPVAAAVLLEGIDPVGVVSPAAVDDVEHVEGTGERIVAV